MYFQVNTVPLKTILFLLTSNTEATENKVQFLNLALRTAYNHDKERIDLPPPLTRIEMEVP